tara:strand:- start:272 stop:601 length:330 start_codon:yes stop_codon:yes gene_type:complete
MSQAGFTPIIPYHSTTSGNVPLAGDMAIGEVALNAADRVIFTKDGTGLVVAIGSGATGGGGDTIFIENSQVVTTDYTIPVGKNAMSTGEITINSGVTVTVSAGSTWAII